MTKPTSQPDRVVPGPLKGAPPSLEWIGVDRLQVDPAYQRATDTSASARIIFGMFKCWDWSLCQPLVVARRADGTLFILDGQHRHAGALRRGDIPHLPCVVLSGVAHTEEAETFVALNTRRQRLSQSDLFNAMLAAGDDHAIAVADLLAETGWRIARTKNTAAWKPGDIECAPMLAGRMATDGAAAVRFALTVVREAWPKYPVRQSATLITGLLAVFAGKAGRIESQSELIAMLSAALPDTWVLRGAIKREKNPFLSRPHALAHAIVEALPGNAPQQPVTAPPVIDHLAATGKAFCDQCDKLVTAAEATACRDRFCKSKAAA